MVWRFLFLFLLWDRIQLISAGLLWPPSLIPFNKAWLQRLTGSAASFYQMKSVDECRRSDVSFCLGCLHDGRIWVKRSESRRVQRFDQAPWTSRGHSKEWVGAKMWTKLGGFCRSFHILLLLSNISILSNIVFEGLYYCCFFFLHGCEQTQINELINN